MLRTNIDRTDEQLNTKAPFNYSCSMRIGSVDIPSCGFLSIRVNVAPSHVLPIRLAKVSVDMAGTASMLFVDAENTRVATGKLSGMVTSTSGYVSIVLRNDNGVLAGHLTCISDLVSMLRAAAQLAGGSVSTAGNDFLLLPQCCVPVRENKCAVVSMPVQYDADNDGKSETHEFTTTGNVRIKVGRPLQSTFVNDGDLDTETLDRVVWFETVPEIVDGTIVVGEQGITSLTVAGTSYNCSGKHLVLKAASRSNVRVSAADKENGLVLGGVKDEQ